MDNSLTISPLEVHFDKKILWLVVLSGLILLPSVSLFFFFIDEVADLFLVPGFLLFILFFSPYFLYAARQLRSKSTALYIDDVGIHDNTSPFTVHLVEWGQIKKVEYADGDHAGLSIHLKDPNYFIQKEHNYLRKLFFIYQMKREKNSCSYIKSFYVYH